MDWSWRLRRPGRTDNCDHKVCQFCRPAPPSTAPHPTSELHARCNHPPDALQCRILHKREGVNRYVRHPRKAVHCALLSRSVLGGSALLAGQLYFVARCWPSVGPVLASLLRAMSLP